MLQQYNFELRDRTGREEVSVGTGNTVEAAAQAVMLNAVSARAVCGLGMIAPVRIRLAGLGQ